MDFFRSVDLIAHRMLMEHSITIPCYSMSPVICQQNITESVTQVHWLWVGSCWKAFFSYFMAERQGAFKMSTSPCIACNLSFNDPVSPSVLQKKTPRFRSLALCQCFGGLSLLGCLLRLRMSFDWGTQRQVMPCRGRHAILPLQLPRGATIGSLLAGWSMRRWTGIDFQKSSVAVESVHFVLSFTLDENGRWLYIGSKPKLLPSWEPADNQSNV